jgi:hypothetical protein
MKTCSFLLLVFLAIASCEKNSSGTSLKITVKDSTPRLVNGATVRLFSDSTDMLKNINQLGSSQTTDVDGNVVFSNLSSDQLYAYRVETGCRNNLFPWPATFAFDNHSLTGALTAGEERDVVVFIAPSGAILKIENNGPISYKIGRSIWTEYHPTIQPYQKRIDYYFPGDYWLEITSPNSPTFLLDTLLRLRCGDTTRLIFQ